MDNDILLPPRKFPTKDKELALLQQKIHDLYILKGNISVQEKRLRNLKMQVNAELSSAIDALSSYLESKKNVAPAPPPPEIMQFLNEARGQGRKSGTLKLDEEAFETEMEERLLWLTALISDRNAS